MKKILVIVLVLLLFFLFPYNNVFAQSCSFSAYISSDGMLVISKGDLKTSFEKATICVLPNNKDNVSNASVFQFGATTNLIGSSGSYVNNDSILVAEMKKLEKVSSGGNYSIYVFDKKDQILCNYERNYYKTAICSKSITYESDESTSSSKGSGKTGVNIVEECLAGNGNGIETSLGCIPTDPQALIGWILEYAISIGGGVAFLLMVFAGFLLSTSSGNPEKVKQGQEMLTSAIVGLLFIIFSVFLLQFIGVDILKIPGFGN